MHYGNTRNAPECIVLIQEMHQNALCLYKKCTKMHYAYTGNASEADITNITHLLKSQSQYYDLMWNFYFFYANCDQCNSTLLLAIVFPLRIKDMAGINIAQEIVKIQN